MYFLNAVAVIGAVILLDLAPGLKYLQCGNLVISSDWEEIKKV